MKMIYARSTHPQPLPARREGSLLLRQIPVNIGVTCIPTHPSLLKGGVGVGRFETKILFRAVNQIN